MPLAAVIPQPGTPVEVRELPRPELEPGAAILETLYSEVCGTDVHLWDGRLQGVPYPLLPGHVSVGRVIAVRGDVVDVHRRPIREGDQVTFLDVHETCNHCWYCLVAKQTTRCPSRRVYGITYSATEGLLGGWSEQIYLKPGVKILPLGPHTQPRSLIAGGCALPTSLHAIDRAQIQLGDTVVVQGAGPVGISCARLASLAGAARVISIDLHAHRLVTARDLGATHGVLLDRGDAREAIEQVLSLTEGRGADVTIEATGVPAAIPTGLAMTRDGGRYVVVGHYTDGGDVAINPHTLINRKHVEIRGCWGSDFSHFYRMTRLLEDFHDRGLDFSPLVSHEYGLDQLNEALEAVRRGEVVKAIVVPNPAALDPARSTRNQTS